MIMQQDKKSPAGQRDIGGARDIIYAPCTSIVSGNSQGGKAIPEAIARGYFIASKPRFGKDQAEILVRIEEIPQSDSDRKKLEQLFARLCIRHFGCYKVDLSCLWLRLQKRINVDRERVKISTLLGEVLNA